MLYCCQNSHLIIVITCNWYWEPIHLVPTLVIVSFACTSPESKQNYGLPTQTKMCPANLFSNQDTWNNISWTCAREGNQESIIFWGRSTYSGIEEKMSDQCVYVKEESSTQMSVTECDPLESMRSLCSNKFCSLYKSSTPVSTNFVSKLISCQLFT